ncbi:MAG: DUF167 family protein [Candidatus Thermoplasmatota archaeon]|jgi:uncharacterized protein YggU (UPF0235/DUF167 family)|nr:DUF167 family protein [Candidatus Thermoplasmatota archaeon]
MRHRVLVRPGNDPIEERNGILIVHTQEKRKNNRANMDVIKQLSRYYSVSQSRIRIVTGATSQKKIIEILEDSLSTK